VHRGGNYWGKDKKENTGQGIGQVTIHITNYGAVPRLTPRETTQQEVRNYGEGVKMDYGTLKRWHYFSCMCLRR